MLEADFLGNPQPEMLSRATKARFTAALYDLTYPGFSGDVLRDIRALREAQLVLHGGVEA